MLLFSEDEDESVFMLKSTDFPNYYVDFMHPDDYTLRDTPFFEKIFHRKRFHNRIFVRICFKVDTHSFLPLTFIIDTGCPMFLYLCPKAKENLQHIIKVDEFDTECVNISGKNFSIDETPHVYSNCINSVNNVNIIGLMALNYFGLTLIDGDFGFERLPEHF